MRSTPEAENSRDLFDAFMRLTGDTEDVLHLFHLGLMRRSGGSVGLLEMSVECREALLRYIEVLDLLQLLLSQQAAPDWSGRGPLIPREPPRA